jgi:cytochrome c-type biogenesis protein CcmH/NrfG
LGEAGYALGNTAVRLNAIILALAIPLASAIAVSVLLALRILEARLQRQADQAARFLEDKVA